MGAVVTKKASRDIALQTGSPPEPLNQSSRGSTSVVRASSAGVPPAQHEDDVDVTVPRTNDSSMARETTSPSPLTPSPSPSETHVGTNDASLSRSSLSSSDSGARETTSTKRGLVARCLHALESGFGVTFERAQLLDNVQEVYCEPRETLLAAQQNAVGVYIVEEGCLEVLSPGEDAVVLCRLQPGDLCGELSSLFNIPCTATVRAQPGVRTKVLLLPLNVLPQSSHEEEVPMYRLLKWCTKRSYVGTTVMFDKLDPSLLINAQIANCLKGPNSLFSTWSNEARNHIASKSTPILFSSGDVLYEIGEKPAFFFLILRGSVELSDDVDVSRSSHIVVRSSSQGCCIGQELLTGSRMAHTARVIAPLLAVPLTHDLLTETVNQFPVNSTKWRDMQSTRS